MYTNMNKCKNDFKKRYFLEVGMSRNREGKRG
jgi:hypothetical protein